MFPYGHVECSFDSIAEQGLTGGQKFSTQYHEVVVFSEKLRSKGSFGHVECSSENPGNNNLVGGQKNSPQNQKGWILLPKKISKMFVWTRNNQFLHLCHKTFARRPKIFGSMSKKDEKTQPFRLKKTTQLFPYGHLDCSFHNSVEMFFRKIFSVSVLDWKERKKNSKKSIKIFQRTRRRWLWQPHPKKLQHKAKTFSLDLQNWDEKDSFSETVLFLKMFLMGTRKSVLAGPPKIFLQLPKSFRSSSACFEKNQSSGKKIVFPRNVSLDT